MTPFNFDAFKSDAEAEGYDEVVEKTWEPDAEIPAHSHPYAVMALVVRGEMWLTSQDETRHFKPGDIFTLEHGEPHAERYGPQGATYWVARINP